MGDDWVLLVDETLVSRVPPISCRRPRCALAAGDPRLPPATKSRVPARGLELGTGLPALPAQGLLGKTHARVGAGGRNR